MRSDAIPRRQVSRPLIVLAFVFGAFATLVVMELWANRPPLPIRPPPAVEEPPAADLDPVWPPGAPVPVPKPKPKTVEKKPQPKPKVEKKKTAAVIVEPTTQPRWRD